MKKEGFNGRWTQKPEKEKEKKLQKFFGSSEKISTFAVPTETEGKQKKDKDRRNAYRNIADTEVEAQKFFKKTQSCKRDE